jgi:hypothetical protein
MAQAAAKVTLTLPTAILQSMALHLIIKNQLISPVFLAISNFVITCFFAVITKYRNPLINCDIHSFPFTAPLDLIV